MNSSPHTPLLLMHRTFIVLGIIGFLASVRIVADPLANVDFEQATTNTITTTDPQFGIAYGPIEDLLPNWQIEGTLLVKPDSPPDYKNVTNQLSRLEFRKTPAPLDLSAALIDTSTYPVPGSSKEGKYSLVLSTIRGSYYDSWLTLSQKGDVPVGAAALLMSGLVEWTGGISFTPPTMNGLPLRELYTGEFSTYAWDVSPFAGQTVEFQFTVPPGYSTRIDSFAFIPEPAPRWLWGCAVAVLLTATAQRVGERHARYEGSHRRSSASNEVPAPNAGIALPLQREHHRPGVGEVGRSVL